MKLVDYIIREHDEWECTYGYQHSIIHVRNFFGGSVLVRATMQELYRRIPDRPKLGEAQIVEMSLDLIEDYPDVDILDTLPVELRPRSIFVSFIK